jgi:hypothetical protein
MSYGDSRDWNFKCCPWSECNKPQNFECWMCFRLPLETEKAEPTLLGQLQGATLNPCIHEFIQALSFQVVSTSVYPSCMDIAILIKHLRCIFAQISNFSHLKFASADTCNINTVLNLRVLINVWRSVPAVWQGKHIKWYYTCNANGYL